jgi:hypothetical protein
VRSLDIYEHKNYFNVTANEKAIVATFHKLSTSNHRITEECV